MKNNTSQVQGIEALPGWMIGRAPLALRGIRFADNGDGGNGGEGGSGGTGGAQTPPVPAPQPPAPQPAPPAPDPRSDDEAAKYRRELRDEAQQHRLKYEASQAELAAERTAREAESKELAELRAERDARTRTDRLTVAAKDVADLDALLDSNAFAQSIKDVDTADADKLAAAVKTFVDANPRFAITPAKPTPPGRGPAAPSSTQSGNAPLSLNDALTQHYAAQQ